LRARDIVRRGSGNAKVDHRRAGMAASNEFQDPRRQRVSRIASSPSARQAVADDRHVYRLHGAMSRDVHRMTCERSVMRATRGQQRCGANYDG
jgi:hypothetical protein